MNIYDYTTQNDPYAAQVIHVGIGIDAPLLAENNNDFDFWAASDNELSNILTWGCMDPSISFSFSNNITKKNNSPKIRKVDFKSKTQWLS